MFSTTLTRCAARSNAVVGQQQTTDTRSTTGTFPRDTEAGQGARTRDRVAAAESGNG